MKQVKKILLLFVLLGIFNGLSMRIEARQPVIMNGVEIKIALKKLLNLGSVLYIAAHPDDENTAVLAYMCNERLMRTGYLSITRGGGGQNLIGSEKGLLMSVLRTHELLGARKIDGAEQFFTRAVDFGYSKTSEESIKIWGKEDILEDIVFVIRKFQPDVILTRFPSERGFSRHGHHTASTILAVEAFHAAGDPSRFPGQLKYVSPWKPKRILWNTWRPYFRDAKPEETAKLIAVNVGTYNPLLGKSYYEIASLSRSMHKSQGFGSVPRRGEWLDYFDLLAGEPAKEDLFEGIDTSWNRVPGAQKLQKLLEKANQEYRVSQPQGIVPLLLKALSELRSLPESYWTLKKTKELKEVIRSCAGLWLEATADTHTVTPGQEINVTVSMINRSDFPFILTKIVVPVKTGDDKVIPARQPLVENKRHDRKFSMKIIEKEYTHPFWLKETPQKGIYRSANHELRGMAAAPYPLNVKIVLEGSGEEVSFETPVLYRWRDPVEGERIRDLRVTPPVTVNFTGKVFYFTGAEAQTIGMILRSGPAPVSGTLKLNLPSSWKAEPAVLPFTIEEPLTEKRISFKVTPPLNDTSCNAAADVVVGDRTFHLSQLTIEYPHLPILTLHPKAEVRLVRVNVNRRGQRIGYIMGSGDDIPQYLAQVGFRVDILSDEDLQNQNLDVYDAVITGVRAYNTRDVFKHVQKSLLDYAAKGGRMIVQYNVSRGLKVQQLGPYPLRISRSRVSEEDAAVTLLDPQHPLLFYPNKILPGDFEGWVQERGLYFADQWDANYTPLLSSHDSGEDPQKGGLLFSQYGSGYFIYTGYSFFRQLPAGVPGALKLFVNMIDGETQ
ncbi:MAG: LmbE family protein [Candidatus Aminicenantes bacterium]|nr:LmbE family protein [Candidatus Aminicenantes bacterium]NIM80033.1 LmbE family protein [Candidatus Aminicenantes bacterium]NIN18294.1 LmbE family protein [Candidatus Aminicenantes bacterium]NIN42191.1 LmbE family protein [Candidatus Aminicenantes bacterium]NIN84947.1 LmbE family protein [Candidatus Aminicenantes bacterium]